MKEEMNYLGTTTAKEKRIPDATILANGTQWQTGHFQLVKKEPCDDMAMSDKLFQIKDESLSDDKESLSTFASNQLSSPSIIMKRETCECTGPDCLHCIEADRSKESIGNTSSAFESLLDDDSDRMPDDWFCGASGDSEEETDDTPMAVSAASVSNFPIKAEPLSEDQESLSLIASPQPAPPSIVVKGETCPCTGHCLDCQAKRSPPCPECGKTFPSNAGLIRHLRVHTGERPYVCAQCPKAFKRLGTLKGHQLTHQAVRVRPFRCTAEECGKEFTTNRELAVHFRRHTGQRPFKCDNCGKTFASNAKLIRHLRVHTGERPYVCVQCPKAFKRLWNLKQHQLTHQAVRVRPFKCTAEGCGKAFTTNSELTIHFRRHTGQRPFKCVSCNKGFNTSFELTLHFRKHTGERPYRCLLCPKAFAQSSNARTHQRTAHPRSP